MHGVENENEFANPRRLRRWYLRASGWRDARSRHEGGIWNPLEVKLRRGQVLYRIGHSRNKGGTVPVSAMLSGEWWMEPEGLAAISISSQQSNMPAQTMARLKLSVSERYGVFDTIVCVRLRQPLGALRGGGNPVYDWPEDDDSSTPGRPPVWASPDGPVMQCFIPGLRDLHGRPTDLADQAFELIGARPVHAWQLIDRVGIAGSVTSISR